MNASGYSVSEGLGLMLIVAAIGVLIGWILRRSFGSGSRLSEAKANLEAEKARYTRVSEDLGYWRLKAELSEAFDAKTTDLEEARRRTRELQSNLVGVRGALEAANSTVSNLKAELAASSLELAGLRTAHAVCGVAAQENRAKIARLESTIDALEAQSSEVRAHMTSVLVAAEAPAGHMSEPKTRVVDLRGAPRSTGTSPVPELGTFRADHVDDLQVIHGIGPKMEQLLNDFGIHSWEQLATLRPTELAMREGVPADFPGRIERNQWVRQAKHLLKRFPDPENRPDRKAFSKKAPSEPTPASS